MLLDFFPKMMEDLEAKVTSWNLKEDENFSFDGVSFLELLIRCSKVFFSQTYCYNIMAIFLTLIGL